MTLLRYGAPGQERAATIATGEHEATRWGFRMLLDMECCDILQPDVGWCGGITELIKISALADARGKLAVPHGSSVYSYHFVITRHNSPFAESLAPVRRATAGETSGRPDQPLAPSSG